MTRQLRTITVRQLIAVLQSVPEERQDDPVWQDAETKRPWVLDGNVGVISLSQLKHADDPSGYLVLTAEEGRVLSDETVLWRVGQPGVELPREGPGMAQGGASTGAVGQG